MADNLKIQEQINKLIEDRKALIDSASSALKQQVEIATKLSQILDSTKIKEDIVNNLNKTKDALGKATDEAKNFGKSADDSLKEFEEGIEDSWLSLDELYKRFGEGKDKFVEGMKEKGEAFKKNHVIAGTFFDGLIDGFRLSYNAMKGLVGLSSSLVSGFFNVAKSILAIPFKVFGRLIDAATEGGGANELMQAFENIRKEFGSFKEDVSKNVIASAKSMRGELANTGLSVIRVFGMAHERLDFFRELAGGMGATFHSLGIEIAQNAEVVGAFQKGLGIAKEEMAGFGQLAIRSGTPLTEVLRQTSNYTLQMGETFGISQKLIGKDISKMVKDVKNFGSVSIKQMSEASIFARKLGVEVTKLFGVFEKFDNFEDAATGAAKLSQVFGANVDALKLMNAQDPSTRVEMLRQSLKAAGKDAANMTRQELNLLSAQTGLDAETTKMVFSLKNQGKSLKDIQKESGKAEKKQLSQTEAMSKLADSIERLVRSGSMFKGGFLDYFVRGFTQGIKGMYGMNFEMTSFHKIMMNIRHALMTTYWAGVKVGEAFRKMFPGVEKMFRGIAEFFNPKRFSALFNGTEEVIRDKTGKIIKTIRGDDGIVGAFKGLFKELGDPSVSPEKAMKNFFGKIKDAFMKFFSGEGEVSMQIFDGFKDFGKAIIKGITGLIPVISEGLVSLLDTVIDFIKDPTSFGNKLNPNSALGGIAKLLAPLGEALKKAWVLIEPKLDELFALVLEKIKKFFLEDPRGRQAIYVGLAFLFGPSVIGGVANVLMTSLLNIFLSVFKGIFAIGGRVAQAAISGMSSMGASAGQAFGAAAGAAAAVYLAYDQWKKMQSLMDDMADTEKKKWDNLRKLAEAGQVEKVDRVINTLRNAAISGNKLDKELEDRLKSYENLAATSARVIKLQEDIAPLDPSKQAAPDKDLTNLQKQNSEMAKAAEVAKTVTAQLNEKLGVNIDFNADPKQITKQTDDIINVVQELAKKLEKVDFEYINNSLSKLEGVKVDKYVAPFKSAFEEISGIWDSIEAKTKKTTDGIQKTFVDLKKFTLKHLESFWDAIEIGWKTREPFFKDMFKALVKPMLEPFIKVFDELAKEITSESVKSMISNLKNDLGIHSPSTVMEGIGDNIVAGMMKPVNKMPKQMMMVSSNVRDGIVKLNREISNSMTEINKQDAVRIKPLMEVLGDGIGNKGKISIENRPTPLEIHLDVKMSTDTVEQTLINNPRSKIARIG